MIERNPHTVLPLSLAVFCSSLALGACSTSTPTPEQPQNAPEPPQTAQTADDKDEPAETAKVAPSAAFDLTSWKLTLPELDESTGKAQEIKEAPLNGSGDKARGYSHERWFYTSPKGALIFKTPNHLATTKNSKNTRSELREMVRRGDTEIGTKSPKNNWVIAAHPQAAEYGAIGGVMKAKLAVDWVSTSGNDKKWASYAVVVGQIHGSGKTEPLKIFYRKLPDHEKGSLFWNYEIRPENQDDRLDVSQDIWGSHTLTADSAEPEDGIKLGEVFSYRVDVKDSLMQLTFERDGQEAVTFEHDLSQGHAAHKIDQGYATDWMYFKAGAYNQCNLGTEGVWGTGCSNRGVEAGDYTQVRFLSLSVEH